MRFLLAASIVVFAATLCSAETWERFRGPRGDGTAIKQNLPTEFNEKSNLLWKVKLPGPGNSSPVVWNDRIFVQSASTDGTKRYLLCLDAKTGQKLWEKSTSGVKAATHKQNSLASASPATDGSAVYVASWDGTEISLSAFTIKGEPMWTKNLGEFTSQHGPGASPIVYKDKVFYNLDMDGKAAIYAFDKHTGKQIWMQPRKAFRACYSAPQFLENRPHGTEMLVTSTTAITSYNPDTGKENWNWTWTWGPKTKPLRTIASSLEVNNTLYAFAGDGGGDRHMVALQLPASQDGVPMQAWENKKDFPYVPCSLIHDGRIYFTNDRGFAGCFDAKTGKQIWYERIPGATFTASPILVDGNIIAASEEGDVYVIAAEPAFRLIENNRIGEVIRASPAVADGRLLVRTLNHLYCFGKAN
jgi:outer membrane protein assembly factor BamB